MHFTFFQFNRSHDYQHIDVAYDCHVSPRVELWRNRFAFKDLSAIPVTPESAVFVPEAYSYNLTDRTVETTGQFSTVTIVADKR